MKSLRCQDRNVFRPMGFHICKKYKPYIDKSVMTPKNMTVVTYGY